MTAKTIVNPEETIGKNKDNKETWPNVSKYQSNDERRTRPETNPSINASSRSSRSILDIRFRVRVAGIARVAVGVTLLAGVVGWLPGLLLGRLAGLQGVHLAGDGVYKKKLVDGLYWTKSLSLRTYLRLVH